MPPWDADPRYGDFSNDISLDDREIAIVKRWVELGAPEGDRAKLPAAPALPPPGSWKMGRQPDYVIDLAAVDVPADGPDLFVTQIFGSDIPAGKWVQAIELLPGNTDVLHHVVTYLGPFGMSDDDDDGRTPASPRPSSSTTPPSAQIGMAEAPRIGGVWVAGSPPSRSRPVTASRSPPVSCSRSTCTTTRAATPAPTARSSASTSARASWQKEVTTAFAADPGMLIPGRRRRSS